MARRALVAAMVLGSLQVAGVLVYRAVTRATPPEVERPDGTRVALPDDRPVLLHLWATWCAPCRDELPGLLDFGERLGGRGGPALWAVTLDRDWAAPRAFFGGPIPGPVHRAVDATLARRYGAEALPVTLVLDARGAVVRRFDGARDWRGLGPEALGLE